MLLPSTDTVPTKSALSAVLLLALDAWQALQVDLDLGRHGTRLVLACSKEVDVALLVAMPVGPFFFLPFDKAPLLLWNKALSPCVARVFVPPLVRAGQ